MPALQAHTASRISIPAEISAMLAALMHAHRTLPSICSARDEVRAVRDDGTRWEVRMMHLKHMDADADFSAGVLVDKQRRLKNGLMPNVN
jgi:hypothetical protein